MKALSEADFERDYYDWLRRQAVSLRYHKPAFLDWANLAEELEAMARNEENALASFIERLLVHLLKWAYTPRKRSGSWEASIANSRDEIADRLNQSPALKHKLGELFERAYVRARRTAGAEMKLRKHEWEAKIPAACPWPLARVLDPDFWPAEKSTGDNRH